MLPLIGSLGTTELLIILGIVILLFGATKLPDLARGSGRALRIFKAETKGLLDEDEETTASGAQPTPEQRELEARQADLEARQAALDAEREGLNRPDGT